MSRTRVNGRRRAPSPVAVYNLRAVDRGCFELRDVDDAEQWERWLDGHEGRPAGVWDPQPMGYVAEPPGAPPPGHDLLKVFGGLAVSRRAAAALGEVVEGCAQLLALDTDPPGYHLLHPTGLIEPMVERPLVEWSVERGDWTQTGRWVARRDLLDGVTVFKRPTWPQYIFVTDPFADRVGDAALTGFDLQALRPLGWVDGSAGA